jgi:hypothetical protein
MSQSPFGARQNCNQSPAQPAEAAAAIAVKRKPAFPKQAKLRALNHKWRVEMTPRNGYLVQTPSELSQTTRRIPA